MHWIISKHTSHWSRCLLRPVRRLATGLISAECCTRLPRRKAGVSATSWRHSQLGSAGCRWRQADTWWRILPARHYLIWIASKRRGGQARWLSTSWDAERPVGIHRENKTGTNMATSFVPEGVHRNTKTVAQVPEGSTGTCTRHVPCKRFEADGEAKEEPTWGGG